MLNAAAILAAQDLAPTKVDVPEWGGFVFVRALSGAERGALEAEAQGDKANHLATLRQRMAGRCICDDKGQRIFTDEQIPELGKKSAAALDRIMIAISKVNALGDEGLDEAGKLSTGDQSAGSGSVSP